MYGPARPPVQLTVPAPARGSSRGRGGGGRGRGGRGRGRAIDQGVKGIKAATKRDITGWEVDHRDLPPNNTERRLYHPDLELNQRLFNAIKSFRALRRWTPLKARVFTAFLNFGGLYMHVLASRYGDVWIDIEEQLDVAAQGKAAVQEAKNLAKHKHKKPEQRRGFQGERRKLEEIEEGYDRVPDIEGVVRAFLTGWLEAEGLDRNFAFVETCGLVVFSFVRFLVQRTVMPEVQLARHHVCVALLDWNAQHEEALERAFEVARTGVRSLPAAFQLGSHLPGSLGRAVCLLLAGIDRPLITASASSGQTMHSHSGFGSGLSVEEARSIVSAQLPSPSPAGWRVHRRSTATARRIERTTTVTTATSSVHTLHLAAHAPRAGLTLLPEGYSGPLTLRIDEAAAPFAMAGLILEGDYLELIPFDEEPNREEEAVWIIDKVWTVTQGFHLELGDEYGEPEEVSSEDAVGSSEEGNEKVSNRETLDAEGSEEEDDDLHF